MSPSNTHKRQLRSSSSFPAINSKNIRTTRRHDSCQSMLTAFATVPSSVENDEEPVTPTISDTVCSNTPVKIAVNTLTSSLPAHETVILPAESAATIDKPPLPATVNKKSIVPAAPVGRKWCHFCGTMTTPRWRAGPLGPSTFCNACYLRWKVRSMPSEQLQFVDHPAFHCPSSVDDTITAVTTVNVSTDIKKLPTKRISFDNNRPASKRLKGSDHLVVPRVQKAVTAPPEIENDWKTDTTDDVFTVKPTKRLLRSNKQPLNSCTNNTHSDPIPVRKQEENDITLNHDKERNALLAEFFDITMTELANVSVKPRVSCCRCVRNTTPLWRAGPFGPGTLCNACGLKWAKVSGAAKVLNVNSAATGAGSRANEKHGASAVSISTKYKPIPTAKLHKPRIPHHILLRNRKDFIKHALYHDDSRIIKFSFETILQSSTANKSINSDIAGHSMTTLFPPLPEHQGSYLISKQRDFELPADILQERELGLIRSDRQPRFIRIRSNIFVERKPAYQQKPLSESAVAICQCQKPSRQTDSNKRTGCGEDCLNRLLFYECDPKYCPCGDQCSNQRFQRKETKKGLQIFRTNSRGWGLRTLKPIKKDELIIEYRGEVISQELCEERMLTMYADEKNFYFLDYAKGEVIDACTKGTEARFINHSCNPNCHIEKWSFRGESHFGVFASKDIEPYSELFYDYNFSTFNGSVESQQPCYCGSRDCRGTIGKKSSKC